MRIIGLIGNKLGHSFSKAYFTEKWNRIGLSPFYRYENFELDSIHDLPGLIQSNPDLVGFNVTVPFKEDVLQYCNQQDDLVRLIGAANTVVIHRENNAFRLEAFNTDVAGFEAVLNAFPIPENTRAMIFGTGGASKAVAHVLTMNQIPFVIISREAESKLNYSEVTESMIQEYHLLINTTPLGMYPEVDRCPDIPYRAIGTSHRLIDVIYNPEKTQFLSRGESQGAIIQNGLQMLIVQAEEAWVRFSNLESNQIVD
jgi:shikimate dehydrogenase